MIIFFLHMYTYIGQESIVISSEGFKASELLIYVQKSQPQLNSIYL